MQKLNTLGSVLYIAAHPDDENTRLITYLSKEKKYRTTYLSLTRGDGGQNLIGDEKGDLLGLIRTHELLEARKIDGGEQYFTRAVDFGYSKSPEETSKFWNKDTVLSDIVRIIRKVKPDVIICRFPGDSKAGHGHHSASAILALEAFDAAADSNQFRDQLSTLSPWKSERIFWNTYNFSSGNTTSEDQLKIDVGVFDPLSGVNYGEIASESRTMHKSQGFGSSKSRGERIEYFKLLKGSNATADLLENINTTWDRIDGGKSIGDKIEKSLASFDFTRPSNTISSLIEIYKSLAAIKETDEISKYWKQLKTEECKSLILACSGLFAEAWSEEEYGVPGYPVKLTSDIINRSETMIELVSVIWPNGTDSLIQKALKTNDLNSFATRQLLNKNTEYTTPYWLKNERTRGWHQIEERSMIGNPENKNSLSVILNVIISGESFALSLPLNCKKIDPVKGELYSTFEILPPVSIQCSDPLIVFTSPGQKKKVNFIISSFVDSIKGELSLSLIEDWKVVLSNPQFTINKKGGTINLQAEITTGSISNTQLSAFVRIDDDAFDFQAHRIAYDHIGHRYILRKSNYPMVRMDIKTTGGVIGYIPGAGDEVASCLKQVGYQVEELNEAQLSSKKLSGYKAIITGIRAYNTNDWLIKYHDKLMNYVKGGGNMIVQYNTNSRIGPLNGKLGPYPFNISRSRVTQEDSPVSFANPAHPALNVPNKISPQDFSGWVQERGIYFAEEADKAYQTPLLMNDSNEEPHNGSLIIAPFGKGNFTYTGIVFFRELPAGVPGAYRLITNLIELPQHN